MRCIGNLGKSNLAHPSGHPVVHSGGGGGGGGLHLFSSSYPIVYPPTTVSSTLSM